MKRPSLRSFPTLAALAAVSLAATLYWPGLAGPFLLDDFDTIFPLAALYADGRGWIESLMQAPALNRMRWVSNLSFLCSHALAGGGLPPSAFAHKFGNLLIHLICASLTGLLAWRLAQRWGGDERRSAWIGVLALAIFALHPLLVSTVLYSVQRMAQLATLFSLLSVLAYLRWRVRLDEAGAIERRLGLGAVLLLAVLAFFSKESGALVPLLILAVELTAFRWPATDHPTRSKFETGFGLACAAPLVLGIVVLVLRLKSIAASYTGRDFSLPERLMTQLHVLADYLGQILFPRLAGMGLYRDDFPVTRSLDASTSMLALCLLTLLGLAFAARRRWPAFAFGVFWFLAAHAMESTVLPLEMVFEHRNYLALIGPTIALVYLVTSLPRPATAVVAVAIVLALSIQTYRRIQDWSSYERWIRVEAGHHPTSLRAGTDYFVHLVGHRRTPEAVEVRERLVQSLPASAQPTLLKLAFACPGPIPVTLWTDSDLATLRTLHIGKDAFHVFVGLRDRMDSGWCANPDWSAFAQASATIADNPHVARLPQSAIAWRRLHVDALQRTRDWNGTAAALDRVFALADNDPRDWLLLMRVQLELGSVDGYQRARARAIALGAARSELASELQALDAETRRRFRPTTP